MTQDIQFQIECLAAELTEMLMAEYGWDIHRALDELYSSNTFAKFNDPECGLYYQGAVYLFQFLKSEIKLFDPACGSGNLIFLDYKGVRDWNKDKILQSNVPYRL